MKLSRICSGVTDGFGPSTSKSIHSSPFEAALGDHRRALARPLALQFFGADAKHHVRVDGAMRRIWHRRPWLRPLFRLLARADIFFPESGRDVPGSMIVTSAKDGAAWRRTFWFSKTRHFNATMTYRETAGLTFGFTILTNDCLWWPAFAAFLREAARLSGGWRPFLAGR